MSMPSSRLLVADHSPECFPSLRLLSTASLSRPRERAVVDPDWQLLVPDPEPVREGLGLAPGVGEDQHGPVLLDDLPDQPQPALRPRGR